MAKGRFKKSQLVCLVLSSLLLLASSALGEKARHILAEDGSKFGNNLPVESVSPKNRETKSELARFLGERSEDQTTASRSLVRVAADESVTRAQDLMEAVIIREYLRRRATGAPASIGFDREALNPFLFNGLPVSGGRDGLPFNIAGESVEPTPLEGFSEYRDNQRTFAANARIFQGQFTNDFLDVVLLGGAGDAICTGTLVAPNVVLSAAHCACDFQFSEVRFGSSRAHSTSIPIQGTPTIFDPTICEAGNSRSWQQADWRKGDIALYRLKTNAEVEPRALAPVALADTAQFVLVVGFGRTEFNQVGGFKYKAEVPIATQTCSSEHTNDDGKPAPEVFGCAEGAELVAASKDMRDTCSGDSGGPAFVRLTDANGQTNYFLAGVTSRSVIDPAQACGSGGIYVRVRQAVESWLRAQVPTLKFADDNSRLASVTTSSF